MKTAEVQRTQNIHKEKAGGKTPRLMQRAHPNTRGGNKKSGFSLRSPRLCGENFYSAKGTERGEKDSLVAWGQGRRIRNEDQAIMKKLKFPKSGSFPPRSPPQPPAQVPPQRGSALEVGLQSGGREPHRNSKNSGMQCVGASWGLERALCIIPCDSVAYESVPKQRRRGLKAYSLRGLGRTLADVQNRHTASKDLCYGPESGNEQSLCQFKRTIRPLNRVHPA